MEWLKCILLSLTLLIPWSITHRCLQYLRAMPHVDVCLGSESIWALTPAQALHPSADSVIDACERALHIAGTSKWALGRLERQALEARWDTQMELEAGGLTVRTSKLVFKRIYLPKLRHDLSSHLNCRELVSSGGGLRCSASCPAEDALPCTVCRRGC